MVARVGKVAYRLLLPLGSKVHLTFHVSQLKKHIETTPMQSRVPVVDSHVAWSKELVRVLDRMMVKRGNQAVTEVLIGWSNTFPEDTTWESLDQIKARFPSFDP